jgi:alpha-galactosidase
VEVPVLASNAVSTRSASERCLRSWPFSTTQRALRGAGRRRALKGDAKAIYHAVAFDPLTSAVLSLEEIRAMVNEMFKANAEYLPHFKSLEVKR